MYEIKVSWVTDIFDVVMIDTMTYTVVVRPLNINEPGAELETKEVGFYIRDFVGNTYEIIETNVGGNPRRVKVIDLMNVGLGPQSGQQAYVYESVQYGYGPIVGPVRHDRLDRSSKETSQATEQEVAWFHRGVKEETNDIDNITTIVLGTGISATFELGTGWGGGNKMILNSASTSGMIEDQKFTFKDVEAGGIQWWDIDLNVSWLYIVVGAWLETDNGTLDGVDIRINGTAIAGIESVSITTTKTFFPATTDNVPTLDDRIKIFTSASYTGMPTTITGKIVIQRV